MSSAVTPLRKSNLEQLSDAERTARVDLAAAYRVAAVYGWSNLIYNHVTARLPDQPEYFLVKPHNILFTEVCASNLIKLRLRLSIAHQR